MDAHGHSVASRIIFSVYHSMFIIRHGPVWYFDSIDNLKQNLQFHGMTVLGLQE